MQERTEAVVLRGVDYSETSRIVTFFTPGRGKVSCMARGVRRKNSVVAPVLDVLNRVELVYLWKDGRSIQALTEASLLDGFRGIKEVLDKSLYAAFPAELVYKIAHENEPSEGLYRTFVEGLYRLAAWPGSVRVHVCWQVVQILSSAGYEPSTGICCECGEPVGTGTGFAFHGGVTCSRCPSDRTLPSSDCAILGALVANRTACPTLDSVGSVYGLIGRYAARQVESDFRSIRVIEEMMQNGK